MIAAKSRIDHEAFLLPPGHEPGRPGRFKIMMSGEDGE